MARTLAAFLLGLLVLGLGNATGLTGWVRDVKPPALADRLLPAAEAWQRFTETLGTDRYLTWLRARRVDLLEP